MSWLKHTAVIDALLLLALGTVAIFGFHATFEGWTFLVAGVAGLLLGIALAVLAVRLGQPAIVLAVFVVVAFFLLGGSIVLHGLGATAYLPVPGTLSTLLDNSVHGWKKLLTTLPPVDGGPLATIPYLLGLVTGAGGMTLATRLRSAWLPALAPTALLATVILLGIQHPAGIALTGAVYVALLVCWLVVRGQRQLRLSSGGRRLTRRATAAVLCVGTAAIGILAGPHLPGYASDRTVLRSHIQPPFNVGQYASPLAGLRRYTKGYVAGHPTTELYNQQLFTVQGLPAGSRVRIATLDNYTGDVWAAANDAGLDAGPADEYQKVGTTLDNPNTGPASGPVTITIDPGYVADAASTKVWVPTAGALTSLSFQRPDQQTAGAEFRYNLATSSGVLPGGLLAGDTYTFTADGVDVPPATPATRAWTNGPTYAAAGSGFESLADTLGGDGSPMRQVFQIAAALKADGAYTDGERPYQMYVAGHSLHRLAEFQDYTQNLMAGDEEQYAAMMAILANQVGVPARVVFGAVVPAGGRVEGKDVHAWVEVRTADGSWATIADSVFVPHRKPKTQSPVPQKLTSSNEVPPPASVRPPTTTGDPLDAGVDQNAKAPPPHHGLDAPAWIWPVLEYAGGPLLAVLVVCGAILGLKAWRRQRRRTRGTPARRLASAWRELLDHARDFGLAVPQRATRREQALLLLDRGVAGADGLAWHADVYMFGESVPADEVVRAYWADVDRLRRDHARGRGRWRRTRAALSLVTLRPRA